MNSSTENSINSNAYDCVDNTSISVKSSEIDSNNIVKNANTTTIEISDTNDKMLLFKNKQDILNLYIKFNKRQSKILKELNETKKGYTVTDFKLKLISDGEAIDLLTQMRLISNNNS